MANNYEAGATIVPASCLAPGGAEAAAQINADLQQALDNYDPDHHHHLDDFVANGLDVEIQGDGSLYLASGDEFFCYPSFEHLVTQLAERKLIAKSFGLSIAWTCSKLRPGEFGGIHYRVMPDGEILSLSTQLDDLTDEQFRQLICTRERPHDYTSAPDA